MLLCKSFLFFLPIGEVFTTTTIHYPISRRGGEFPAPSAANLTYLLEQLRAVEKRFNSVTRSFEENKIVRKPKRNYGTQGSSILLGDVGREGKWFASLQIGDPIQTVDMDMDMLTTDWWIQSTPSGTGSFYLDFNSKTFRGSKPSKFPSCYQPIDIIHFPAITRPVPISFAHCKPAKQWVRTLLPSGAYLGLAPSLSLSQTRTASLLTQLIETGLIDVPVWSILLADGREGIFMIGENFTSTPESLDDSTNIPSSLDKHEELKRGKSLRGRNSPSSLQDYTSKRWIWSQLSGAEGWWQILMHGFWVEGTKLLDNQPVILDVNTPFIIAPVNAARTFYASVSGSGRLSPPFDQFHTYPCSHPPNIQFEFTGWKTPFLNEKRGKGTFSSGERFSLGRTAIGSSYCIGIIVESRMSEEDELSSEVNGNDISDTWVVGEPFFRDIHVAFNWKEKQVGMRKA